jgi:Fe2+ transport system protein B
VSDGTGAVIADPSAGETTRVDALTGLHQELGNWPGVTVEALGADPDIVVAGDRYRFIAHAIEAAVHRTSAARRRLSDKIDRVVLPRAGDIPILPAAMARRSW